MAARVWFTLENTPELSSQDRAIMNRAVRLVWPPNKQPLRGDLSRIRYLYKPGMSANDIIRAMDCEREPTA